VPRTIKDIQNIPESPLISIMVLGKIQSTVQIKNIIITKEKRFKVIILNGKVITLRIGLIIIIKRPITTPTIIIVLILLSYVISFIKYKDKAVPTIPEIILDRKLYIV